MNTVVGVNPAEPVENFDHLVAKLPSVQRYSKGDTLVHTRESLNAPYTDAAVEDLLDQYRPDWRDLFKTDLTQKIELLMESLGNYLNDPTHALYDRAAMEYCLDRLAATLFNKFESSLDDNDELVTGQLLYGTHLGLSYARNQVAGYWLTLLQYQDDLCHQDGLASVTAVTNFLRHHLYEHAIRMELASSVPFTNPALVGLQINPAFEQLKLVLNAKSDAPFKCWCAERGFSKVDHFFSFSSALLAYELSHRYDAAVAVAGGGLPLAFGFELYGVPVQCLRAHGYKNASRSVSDIGPTLVTDRHIAVLENDVYSGSTLRAVLKKLSALEPASVELVLSTGPTQGWGSSYASRIENVPEGFSEIYHPGRTGIANLPIAVEACLELLAERYT